MPLSHTTWGLFIMQERFQKFLATTFLTKLQLQLLGETRWSRDPKYLTKLQFLQVLHDLEKCEMRYCYYTENKEHVVSMKGSLAIFYKGKTSYHKLQVEASHVKQHIAVNCAILCYIKQGNKIINEVIGSK